MQDKDAAALIPCRKMFTQTLLRLARKNRDIFAVTSDATGSVTLDQFKAELPEQFVDVGIAEQNEIGVSAGLAMWGKRPFACAPACFLSARSLEQIKVDVAYNKQNVKVIGISGGISYGALGMSHHSLQDIAVMRAMPNMTVILPSDRLLTEKMTEVLAEYQEPTYVRMGRGAVPDVYTRENVAFTIGKANLLHEGGDITIIACGELVRPALDAALQLQCEGIGVRVLDMHTIKPLDEQAILKAARDTGHIITVEEHSIYGGLGAAVAQLLAEYQPVPMRILGIPDEPVVPGESREVFAHYGLDAAGIFETVKKLL